MVKDYVAKIDGQITAQHAALIWVGGPEPILIDLRFKTKIILLRVLIIIEPKDGSLT